MRQLSETYHIIEMMKATGNRPGVIERWKTLVAEWSQKYRTDPNAPKKANGKSRIGSLTYEFC